MAKLIDAEHAPSHEPLAWRVTFGDESSSMFDDYLSAVLNIAQVIDTVQVVVVETLGWGATRSVALGVFLRDVANQREFDIRMAECQKVVDATTARLKVLATGTPTRVEVDRELDAYCAAWRKIFGMP